MNKIALYEIQNENTGLNSVNSVVLSQYILFLSAFQRDMYYGNVWWTTCLNIVRHKTKYNEHSGVSVTRLTSSTDGIYASIVRSNDDIVKYRYSTKYFSVKPFEMKRRDMPPTKVAKLLFGLISWHKSSIKLTNGESSQREGNSSEEIK